MAGLEPLDPMQKRVAREVNKPAKKKKKTHGSSRRNVWLLIITTLLIIGSFIAFMPPTEKINQGLDIQGGLSVVLQAKSSDGSAISSEDMESSRAIIESRVNALGANEAVVQLQGSDQILVQIPGLSDTQEALSTIGKTGNLVFARLDSFTDEDVKDAIDDGEYSYETVTDDYGNTFYRQTTIKVEEGTYTPLITGSNIKSVSVGKESDTSSYYSVNLDLDAEGTEAFAEATADLVDSKGKIVIILDGVVQSAPAVQSEITGGQVSITGDYSLEGAKSMKVVLESGSLPVSFEYLQSQVVGPTLGQDALWMGVLVALIGLVLVMLYLLVFYKGLGTITAAAMLVFAILYLGLLGLLSAFGQFSLSLAGVAGIVLTIGMAADSSILTLERFREEIRMGRSVRAASITGVHHAIVTSIDADSVTLVSALSLFFLASSSVKGFGLTLALGIFCDIAMMLLFKAPLIRLLAPRSIEKHPKFWGIQDSHDALQYENDVKEGKPVNPKKLKGNFIKKDINFLGYRRIFLGVAAFAIALCFAFFGIKGLNFGVEFVGGTSTTFYSTGDITTEQVRAAYEEQGVDDITIQTTTTNDENGFLVRSSETNAETAHETAAAVAEALGISAENFEVTTIGPDWGTSVIKSSLIAFLVSLVLIIIYIAIRFEYKMGVIAIVALLHDLILVVGIYAIVGREINPNTIAALLTILGYSLYDTVVVFHRINDNMKDDSIKCTFMTMANHSVNQVLLRTINTTLTSLIPVLAMLIFGSETLKDFAFAMVIGLICGSYSSIAIAVPLYSIWKTKEEQFAKLHNRLGAQVVCFRFGEPLNMLTAGTNIVTPEEAEKRAAEAVAVETAQAEGDKPAKAAKAAAPTKKSKAPFKANKQKKE